MIDIQSLTVEKEYDVTLTVVNESFDISSEIEVSDPILIDASCEENLLVYELTIETLVNELDVDNSMTINPNYSTEDIYDGDYTVTPLEANDIVLETKNKICINDITILKVPRYSTSNDYGTTFYIAEA